MRTSASFRVRFGGFWLLLLSLILPQASTAANPEPAPRYDSTTVINVMAIVTEVREVPRDSALSGIHVTARSDNGLLDIYLCPADFLKEFDFTLHRGDRIQVIGSKVKFGTSTVVLAREVRRDARTVYLRDRQGSPNWVTRIPART